VRVREVEPDVPSVETAAGECEREDDAGVLELVLIAGEGAATAPVVGVEPQLRADRLLHAEGVRVLTLGAHRELAAAEGLRLLDDRRDERRRLRR